MNSDKSVSYRILHTTGRETRGRTTVPADDKKAWVTIKALIQGVIGEDADLEHVRVWEGDQYRDMFVDEIGAIKRLPLNKAATDLYRANALAHERPRPDPETMPAVHGDAIVFAQQVWR